jgi:hypothetical protein
MAEVQNKLINNFEARVRQLMLLCDSLKAENASFREAISNKEAEIQVNQSSYNEVFAKYQNLKLAQGVSLNEEDRRNAKARYTKLVREIDKCISLLNE